MAIESESIRPITNELNLDSGFSDIELISSSNHSKVYRAKCDGKLYLLKTPASDSGLHLSMIKREWELGRGLSHPGIARLFSYEASSPVGPCIVMEYVEGRTLSNYIAEGHSTAEKKKIYRNILDTVRYLHRVGIIHNDLKPDNILVANDGFRTKIVDFCLSDDDAHYLDKSLGGTSGYMSPELQRGEKVDARSDIYSLGVILKDLFGTKFKRISSKCTNYDKNDRYTSVNSLISAWKLSGWHKTHAFLAGAAIIAVLIAITKPILNTRHFIAGMTEAPATPIQINQNPRINDTSGCDIAPAAEEHISEATKIDSTTTAAKEIAEKTEAPIAMIPKKRATPIHIDPNLSINGTANCYIIPAAGKYSFDATVKGSTATPVDGIAAKAEVYWESFGTDEMPQVGALIQDVSYSNGKIHFSATGKDGNACIALMDEAGTILWSWHIWCCTGYDPVATAQQYPGLLLMDRNLGATSCTPGDVRCFGLFYQFGRKDPFLASSNAEKGIMCKYSSSFGNIFKIDSDTLHHTLANSIANPATEFILSPSSEYLYEGLRWRKGKNENDPCPPGWHVPSKEDAENAVHQIIIVLPSIEWDTIHHGLNLAPLVLGPETKECYWFPAAGTIAKSGPFNKVGSQILLHSSHSYFMEDKGIFRSRAVRFRIKNINDSQIQDGYCLSIMPPTSLNVRCCKE